VSIIELPRCLNLLILRVGSVLSFGLTSSIAKNKKKRKNKIPKFELILYLGKNYSHLGHTTGSVLILIKYVCFVINFVPVMINVSIIIKIKCVNSDNISDIYDKPYFIKIHINITIFHTFNGTIPRSKYFLYNSGSYLGPAQLP
jgi:hypothetical protein